MENYSNKYLLLALIIFCVIFWYGVAYAIRDVIMGFNP